MTYVERFRTADYQILSRKMMKTTQLAEEVNGQRTVPAVLGARAFIFIIPQIRPRPSEWEPG